MTDVKAIALSALKCPVKRPLDQAWDCARRFAWRHTSAGNLRYDPDGAVDVMREELGSLVRKGVLVNWSVEVIERNYGVSLVVEAYWQRGPHALGHTRQVYLIQ